MYVFCWPWSISYFGFRINCPTVRTGPCHSKKVSMGFKRTAKALIDAHLHVHTMIKAYVGSIISLANPMNMFTDNEGLDQTAQMRSLIRDFLVRICPKSQFRFARLRCGTVFYLKYSARQVFGLNRVDPYYMVQNAASAPSPHCLPSIQLYLYTSTCG